MCPLCPFLISISCKANHNHLYWIIQWTIGGLQWTVGFSIIFLIGWCILINQWSRKKELSPLKDTLFWQHIMMLFGTPQARTQGKHDNNMSSVPSHMCAHLCCWFCMLARQICITYAINISKNNDAYLHRWHVFLLFLCSWPPWLFHSRNPNECWSISLLPWLWHNVMNNWRWQKCTA